MRKRFFPALLAVSALLAPSSAIAAGTSASTDCTPLGDGAPTFARWYDQALYAPAPGGSFEVGAPAWTLASGASLVNEQNPNIAGKRSLALNANTTVQSPWFCAGVEHPTLRFFARGAGAPTGVLLVQVVYRDASEATIIRDVGTVTVAEVPGWGPAFARPLALAIPLLGSAKTPVAIRLKSVGVLSGWRVDDVYVDPYRRS